MKCGVVLVSSFFIFDLDHISSKFSLPTHIILINSFLCLMLKIFVRYDLFLILIYNVEDFSTL